ncbi:MAG: hypothetical protein ACLQMF_14490 [Rectinemataceae bacterium]
MNTSLCFDGFAAIPQGTAAVREKAGRSESRPNPTLRLVLLHNEVFLLPRSSRVLQVLSGKAWVSFEGEDRIIESGDSLALSRARNGAVISATGKEALLFEVTRGELDT